MKQTRIFVSSTHADRYPLGQTRSDVVDFDMKEPIACKGDEAMFIGLENFSAPISRTNVFAQNKTLNFDGGFGNFTVTVPEGQYQSPEAFRLALQNAINAGGFGITVTYLSLTNKITLRNTRTQSINLIGTSPLCQLLGANDVSLALPTNANVTLPRQLDLSGARCINVMLPNFELNSADSLNGHTLSDSILCSVPITVAWGEIQTYQNAVPKDILSNRKNMSSLIVKLVDENGIDYDLGGLEWTALINVTVKKDNFYLH